MSFFDLTHFLDLFLAFIECKGVKNKKTKSICFYQKKKKSICMLSIFFYHVVSHSLIPTNVL